MLCRHVDLARRGQARIRYVGKAGKLQEVRIADRKLAALIRCCHELPGKALFQYRDEDGQVQPVDSGDVNDYLRRLTGGDFTAKDFRTWGATLTAMIELARLPPQPDASEQQRVALQNQVIASVAALLGNTPAVCRKSYVDPRVFHAWRTGQLEPLRGLRGVRQWEAAALHLLRSCGQP